MREPLKSHMDAYLLHKPGINTREIFQSDHRFIVEQGANKWSWVLKLNLNVIMAEGAVLASDRDGATASLHASSHTQSTNVMPLITPPSGLASSTKPADNPTTFHYTIHHPPPSTPSIQPVTPSTAPSLSTAAPAVAQQQGTLTLASPHIRSTTEAAARVCKESLATAISLLLPLDPSSPPTEQLQHFAAVHLSKITKKDDVTLPDTRFTLQLVVLADAMVEEQPELWAQLLQQYHLTQAQMQLLPQQAVGATDASEILRGALAPKYKCFKIHEAESESIMFGSDTSVEGQSGVRVQLRADKLVGATRALLPLRTGLPTRGSCSGEDADGTHSLHQLGEDGEKLGSMIGFHQQYGTRRTTTGSVSSGSSSTTTSPRPKPVAVRPSSSGLSQSSCSETGTQPTADLAPAPLSPPQMQVNLSVQAPSQLQAAVIKHFGNASTPCTNIQKAIAMHIANRDHSSAKEGIIDTSWAMSLDRVVGLLRGQHPGLWNLKDQAMLDEGAATLETLFAHLPAVFKLTMQGGQPIVRLKVAELLDGATSTSPTMCIPPVSGFAASNAVATLVQRLAAMQQQPAMLQQTEAPQQQTSPYTLRDLAHDTLAASKDVYTEMGILAGQLRATGGTLWSNRLEAYGEIKLNVILASDPRFRITPEGGRSYIQVLPAGSVSTKVTAVQQEQHHPSVTSQLQQKQKQGLSTSATPFVSGAAAAAAAALRQQITDPSWSAIPAFPSIASTEAPALQLKEAAITVPRPPPGSSLTWAPATPQLEGAPTIAVPRDLVYIGPILPRVSVTLPGSPAHVAMIQHLAGCSRIGLSCCISTGGASQQTLVPGHSSSLPNLDAAAVHAPHGNNHSSSGRGGNSSSSGGDPTLALLAICVPAAAEGGRPATLYLVDVLQAVSTSYNSCSHGAQLYQRQSSGGRRGQGQSTAAAAAVLAAQARDQRLQSTALADSRSKRGAMFASLKPVMSNVHTVKVVHDSRTVSLECSGNDPAVIAMDLINTQKCMHHDLVSSSYILMLTQKF